MPPGSLSWFPRSCVGIHIGAWFSYGLLPTQERGTSKRSANADTGIHALKRTAGANAPAGKGIGPKITAEFPNSRLSMLSKE
jgi:hypothetical protein